MVKLSFHSNRRPLTKAEVGTRDWVIVVIGLTMFLFGVIWTLDCGLENQMNVLSPSSWVILVGAWKTVALYLI